MTREEAIQKVSIGLLNGAIDCDDSDYYKAIKVLLNSIAHSMSIKALEQEPSGETVSLGVFKQVMWERDIAIEQLKELGYGFGQKIEPKTIQEKQAESEKYQKAFDDGYENGYAQARFDYEQEPKTGHWKRNETIALTYCSECGFGQRIDEYRTYNYCPNCGARMIEP